MAAGASKGASEASSGDLRTPLARQRALVTGAGSGLGAAIAKALAAAGASVAVNWVGDESGAREVADAIDQKGGEALLVEGDVSRERDVREMFERARRAFGGVDILINNAGLQKDSGFAEMTLEQWNEVIGVNLTGQFLCAREAVRAFRLQGIDASRSSAAGKIVCLSSVHEAIPWAGHANYAASKGGVSMLMKTMAQELSSERIRVNAIAPGAIKTPINEAAWSTPEAEAELLKLIPYGRIGKPEDVAQAAVWLASDASDYVVGATIYIDGGMMLYPEFRGHG